MAEWADATIYIDGVPCPASVAAYDPGEPVVEHAPPSFSISLSTTAKADLEAFADMFGVQHMPPTTPEVAINGQTVGRLTGGRETAVGEAIAIDLDLVPFPFVHRACEAWARGMLPASNTLDDILAAWWRLTNGQRARIKRRMAKAEKLEVTGG